MTDKGGNKEIMTDKEIIIRLKRLEKAEREYKEKNKLAYYNVGKVNFKQMEFHKCQKRNRWVFGGNRSGKTECGAVETVWRARGIHPFRQNRQSVGWVVSLTREVQREVAQKKILHYLNPDWIVDVVMVTGKSCFPEGGVIDYIGVKNVFGSISRICFKSCEMGREKFQGASLDYVWFDEEPPEEIYEECRMRIMDKEGDIFGTMTPLLGLTFAYYKIFLNDGGDKDIWHIFMEWADNPYLPPAEIENLSAVLSEEQLRHRRYGQFVSGKGLVYPEFEESVHVIDPFPVPKEWQDKLSIDPGLNNPLSCHWYAVDGDGNVFVMAEHYEAGKDIDYHAKRILEISRQLDWHTDSFGRVNALIDSAANQRTLAGIKSVTELFCERGIQVCPMVDKDLFSGISRVKSYLTARRLFIFSCCTNLIREIKGYWWGAGDVPKKKDDHALDELRYFIMSRPQPYAPTVEKSVITRDKEKLIRKLRYRK